MLHEEISVVTAFSKITHICFICLSHYDISSPRQELDLFDVLLYIWCLE